MKNLATLLSIRAAKTPNAVAFEFHTAGEISSVLTYKQLDQAARSVARQLADRKAFGRTVLLLHPPSLEFLTDFFGCIYAGAIAVPTIPPFTERGLARMATIVQAARPLIGLTNQSGLASLTRRFSSLSHFSDLNLVSLDHRTPLDFEPSPTESDCIAMVQFTSGSTSDARGVQLSHGNILSNLSAIEEAFHLSSSEKHGGVALWLPQFHDMGLFSRLECLWGGFPGYLMSPLEFVKRPFRWLELISKTRASVSGGPNFAFEICADRIS
jgi:acyl-CoA synthetase (AMP-forming)/AMP-acid ligase II